jgi:hypothetical protein
LNKGFCICLGYNSFIELIEEFMMDKLELIDKAVEMVEDWYDYEQQKAITETPPHDTECEYSDSDFIGWKRCKYIGINSHGSKRFAVIFDSEKQEYLNPKICDELKFRVLDRATRAKELEKKRVVDAVMDAIDGKGIVQNEFILKKAYDKGFLKLPENY